MLKATFTSPAEYLAAFDAEISKGGLLVRGATLANAQAGAEVPLTVEVEGLETVELSARIAAVIPGVGVAVLLSPAPEALTALAATARNPPADEPRAPGTLYDRLKAMTVSEKMQLALSGQRDERTALLRDNNKTVHIFVLKNPRIGLDEVQAAAKLPGLSPDALKMIAEHREWSGNAMVCASLVRNPKTPMPLALKLIDRVPMSDLRALAKGGAREQVVQAARKKISG